MTNEFGEKLDSNGYATSLMSKESCCFICHMTPVARHEIFHGFNRQKSKALGLWINVCPKHHSMIHNDAELDISLKKQGQITAMNTYGWTTEDFIRYIGKNYL